MSRPVGVSIPCGVLTGRQPVGQAGHPAISRTAAEVVRRIHQLRFGLVLAAAPNRSACRRELRAAELHRLFQTVIASPKDPEDQSASQDVVVAAHIA